MDMIANAMRYFGFPEPPLDPPGPDPMKERLLDERERLLDRLEEINDLLEEMGCLL